ncbi:MAG TPA: DUF4399 domain-containing protein [Candidatus Binatia bacterium]|nr:DUF4399 domain-containing protein [Candidatus Binatia bacterium]
MREAGEVRATRRLGAGSRPRHWPGHKENEVIKTAALVVVAALLIFAVTCSKGVSCSDTKHASDRCSATPTASHASATKPTAVPPNVTAQATLEIQAPLQGQTVTSPVTVEVASTHLIAAPELNVPNAAHYHVFVDKVPFTAGGMTIPMDAAGVYHFAQNTLKLDIPPGKHTIVLVLGDNSHVRVPESEAHAVAVDIIVVQPTPTQ